MTGKENIIPPKTSKFKMQEKMKALCRKSLRLLPSSRLFRVDIEVGEPCSIPFISAWACQTAPTSTAKKDALSLVKS